MTVFSVYLDSFLFIIFLCVCVFILGFWFAVTMKFIYNNFMYGYWF